MHLPHTTPHVFKEPSPSNRASPVSEQASSSGRDPMETDVSRARDRATGPRIDVYTPLPKAMEPDSDVDYHPNNWKWTHALTFPLEILNGLHPSQISYKWIRYSIGVVTGTEGTLSTAQDSPNSMNYDDPLAASVLYFHTSIQERERAFPIDPDIARTRITSSAQTDRREEFHYDVAERDGEQCILTGGEWDFCQAAHLISHSKGDEYIATFTQRRSRDPTGGDIVSLIDDVRNGIFLNITAHLVLGKRVAFLMTPNFAMKTSDVDPNAPADERRCTSHIFKPTQNAFELHCTSPGTAIRLLDPQKDPPAVIFDGVYADAILHHFGTQELKDVLSEGWKDSFHPHGVMNAAEADQKVVKDARAATENKKVDEDMARSARRVRRDKRRGVDTSHGEPDTWDMLMFLPYALLPKDDVQRMLRKAREKAEAAEKGRLQEIVGPWARDVQASM